jgi:tRNA pseudouridine13 synthase
MQLHGNRSYFIADTVDDALCRRIAEHNIHPTGPLCARGESPVTNECRQLESAVQTAHDVMVQGLIAAGVDQSRRALRVTVPDLAWSWPADDVLVLTFSLPPGSCNQRVAGACQLLMWLFFWLSRPINGR